MTNQTHTIHRSSPKGKGMKFIGTCTQCGEVGLTIADANKYCPNQRGLSHAEALMNAINPEMTSFPFSLCSDLHLVSSARNQFTIIPPVRPYCHWRF